MHRLFTSFLSTAFSKTHKFHDSKYDDKYLQSNFHKWLIAATDMIAKYTYKTLALVGCIF